MPNTTFATPNQSSASIHDADLTEVTVTVVAESDPGPLTAAVLAERLTQSRNEVRAFLAKVS
jgi:hypothetical protein